MELLKEWGPVTVILLSLVILVTIIGGVVVIIEPKTLTFPEYLDQIKIFIIGLGILGVGRGVVIGAKVQGESIGREITLNNAQNPSKLPVPGPGDATIQK